MKDVKVIKYPEIGGKYQHYKGGQYEVMSLAIHSETSEPLVIYKSLLFGSVYARPLAMWYDKIILSEDNEPFNSVSRFTKL